MKAFRHFDLPKQHLTGEQHYVPPKARSPARLSVAANCRPEPCWQTTRRHGTEIVSDVLHVLSDPDDVKFAVDVFSPSAYDTSWYGIARHGEAMRRQLKLPVLVMGDPEGRIENPDLLNDARGAFYDAAVD